jgi:hypothetical protein
MPDILAFSLAPMKKAPVMPGPEFTGKTLDQ